FAVDRLRHIRRPPWPVHFLFPLPALRGEGRVRGIFRAFKSQRFPLTRRYAPTSPRKRQGYRIWLRVSMRKASSQPARLILRRMDAVLGWARRMLRASLRKMARFSGALSF